MEAGKVHRIDDGEGERAPWGSTATELYDILRACCIRKGLPAEHAGALAEALLLDLGEYGGGRRFYLPRAARLRAKARNLRISVEWNGGNELELAERYGLSVRTILRIVLEAL